MWGLSLTQAELELCVVLTVNALIKLYCTEQRCLELVGFKGRFVGLDVCPQVGLEPCPEDEQLSLWLVGNTVACHMSHSDGISCFPFVFKYLQSSSCYICSLYSRWPTDWLDTAALPSEQLSARAARGQARFSESVWLQRTRIKHISHSHRHMLLMTVSPGRCFRISKLAFLWVSNTCET